MDVSLGMIRTTWEPVVDAGNLLCDLSDEVQVISMPLSRDNECVFISTLEIIHFHRV